MTTAPNFQLRNDPTFTDVTTTLDVVVGRNLYVRNGTIFNRGVPQPPGLVFMFAPGYTGTQPGIYSDWNELYANFSKVEGLRTINFSNLYGSLVIPPGHYEMDQALWYCCTSNITIDPSGDFRMHVVISDGATFGGTLCGISGPFAFEYRGTGSSAAFDFNLDLHPQPGHAFVLEKAAGVYCTGTQPFLRVTTAMSLPYVILMDFSGCIGVPGRPSTCPIIEMNGVALCPINMGAGSILMDGTLAGTGPYVIVGFSTGLLKDNGTPFEYPTVQPAVSGSIFYALFFNQTFKRSAAPTVNDDDSIGIYHIGDLWCNTSTNDMYVCANSSPGAAIWKLL